MSIVHACLILWLWICCAMLNCITLDTHRTWPEVNKTTDEPLKCVLGSQQYLPGETWKPVLEEPFGVLNCVQCGCFVINHKNQGRSSRIKCINLKPLCPTPTCANPIKTNQSCCGLCSADDSPVSEQHLFHSHIHLSNKKRSRKRFRSRSSAEPMPKHFDQLLHETAQFVSQMWSQNSLASNDIQQDTNDQPATNQSIDQFNCRYNNHTYLDGQQWNHVDDECSFCFCQTGRVKCEHELCPKSNCNQSIKVKGHCCPICVANESTIINQSETCSLDLDRRSHLPGSTWHPYISPFGQDTCVVCHCSHSLAVSCHKLDTCTSRPLANQLKKWQADQPDQGGASSSSSSSAASTASSASLPAHPTGVWSVRPAPCLHKDGLHEHGSCWHPVVMPFGRIKCVICRCSNRTVLCKRIRPCLA